jgi:hypothetical protein
MLGLFKNFLNRHDLENLVVARDLNVTSRWPKRKEVPLSGILLENGLKT